MRFRQPKPIPEAGFDLTPMIDVILLLIIFFMLTSQFTRSNQMAVDLPREKGEPTQPDAPAAVIIDLNADGSMRLAGEPMEFDRIVQMVNADAKQARSTGATVELVIRADRNCPAAHLNRLTSALSLAGVRTWKLATTSEGG